MGTTAQLQGVAQPITAPTGATSKLAPSEKPEPAARVMTAARVQPVIGAPVPVPTLLQPVDAAALGRISPVQAEAIATNQDEFAARVGGPGQNADDPNYLARWRMAHQLSEQEGEVVLGSVFMEHYRSVLAAQQAGRQ